LGNDIPVLSVTTCATWYTCQSLNKYPKHIHNERKEAPHCLT